jgi:hypothetical protein
LETIRQSSVFVEDDVLGQGGGFFGVGVLQEPGEVLLKLLVGAGQGSSIGAGDEVLPGAAVGGELHHRQSLVAAWLRFVSGQRPSLVFRTGR